MTRRLFLAGLLLAGMACRREVPVTIHVQWTPNPGAEGVDRYTVQLDGRAAEVVHSNICTPTICDHPIIVTPGLHVVTVIAYRGGVQSEPTVLTFITLDPRS